MIEPQWLLIELGYIVGSLGLLGFAATRKSEWVKASVAALAVAMLVWRLLAVVPSWWLYYAEGELGWGGQGCVDLDQECLMHAIKDSIVVAQNGIVLAGVVVAFLIYQRKFPKQLAAGEAKPEMTGGYR